LTGIADMAKTKRDGLPFSLFLALRYLKPKRTFLSIITLISILGVTLGVAVLIVVLSVMTGFDMELRRKIVGFDGHVRISTRGTSIDWRSLLDQATGIDGVSSGAPIVQGPVIMQCRNQRTTPKIRGLDADLEKSPIDLRQYVIEGEYDLSGDTVVIGSGLAENLGAWVGDTITIYSPANLGEVFDKLKSVEGKEADTATVADLKEMILPTTLTVTGIFSTGWPDYDYDFALVPLHISQELYALEDDVHGIVLNATDPYRALEIKNRIQKLAGPETKISTWIEQNKKLFDAIRVERNVMFVLLMFVILVAAFGIMSTLITVTVQKTKEIGVLKALGAMRSQVVWVFLAQGFVVGTLGTTIGLGAGLALLHYRNEVSQWLSRVANIQIFPEAAHQHAAIPAEVVPSNMVLICCCSFLLCAVAAWVPAWFAARLDPVKALRYE
jgi:lipoprotein-releasing system permease protein